MGKMEFSRETSVVSHTIAFQAILAKKGGKILVYDGKKLVLDPWGRSKGATHTVLFSHSRKLAHSRGGIVLYRWKKFCTEENRIVDDLCSQILLCRALCVKKDGDGAAGERPAKRART